MPLSCDCVDDDLEDDDTLDQATVLTTGISSFDAIAVFPDRDLWRIDAPPGSTLHVGLYASVALGASLHLELFDVRRYLATAEGVPAGGRIDTTLPDRTKYYLRVTPSTDSPCAPYQLLVNVVPPVEPPVECNVVCPALPCYVPTCNEQGFCEYVAEDPSARRRHGALVWVPPASVPMGLDGEPVVDVARGFFIDEYEVTTEAFLAWPGGLGIDKQFMDRDPEGHTITDDPGGGAVIASHCETGQPGERGSCAEHPVTYVRRYDARRYCYWRGGYLCGEAQWELAAKGSTQRAYPWGDAPAPGGDGWDPPRANCAEDLCADGYTRAAPVDAFPDDLSPVGCVGMAGNVAEWVADDWDWTSGALPADLPLDGVPWREGLDSLSVVRGGAWRAFRSDTTLLETRHGFDEAAGWIGFRCCRYPSDDPPACECTTDRCP